MSRWGRLLGPLLITGLLLGCSSARERAGDGAATPREPGARGAEGGAGDAGEAGNGSVGESVLASNADRPAVATPGARAPIESFRPRWWVQEPEVAGEGVRIGAMGDAEDLVEARRAAVKNGTEAVRRHLGHEPQRIETERYTVVQLPSGSYRAFVLMNGQP